MFFALLLSAITFAAPCEPNLKAGTKCSIKVEDVRPTQGAFGMLDVEEKRSLIRQQKNLKKFLKKDKNRLKVVIGPEGKYYLIDRHHLTYALDKEKIKNAYAIIVENYSNLTEEKFWAVMKKKGWARFKDENGKSIKKLPSKISELKDDLFRTLAWVVRNSGAFKKTKVPFSEFYWADRFREEFSTNDLKKNWDDTVKKAIELANSSKMKGLPGFLPVTENERPKKIKECLDLYRQMNFNHL